MEQPSLVTRSDSQWSRWTIATMLAGAATACIVAACWFGSAPKPAWAMKGLPQRLRSLHSLHVVGEVFEGDGKTAHPMEIFVQQPDLSRINGTASMENGKLIARSEVINTPAQRVTIDRGRKQASVEPQTPERARFAATEMLDGLSQMVLQAGSHYQKVRSEIVSGQNADVYEAQLDDVNLLRLWVNARSGLPLRFECYDLVKDQPPRITFRYDIIESDIEIAKGTFDPSPPAGFAVTELPMRGDDQAFDALQFDRNHLLRRFAAKLDNGDLLLCWALYDDRRPADDLKMLSDTPGVSLRFSAADGSVYVEHPLRVDAGSAGYHWRWSLLRSATNDPSLIFHIRFSAPTFGGGAMTSIATRVEPAALRDQLSDIQHNICPADTHPLMLEQIEEAVR